MTDDELRALVRDAIGRHLGPGSASPRPEDARPEPPWRGHPSFGKFLQLPGDVDSGPCMIEPAVSCNHCGFCKSYGN